MLVRMLEKEEYSSTVGGIASLYNTVWPNLA